ncbi:MAG: nitroreductase family protein, partial [Alloprevotella sp.]|nr:nitroreductase family protein [Alloprevotella sp.]
MKKVLILFTLLCGTMAAEAQEADCCQGKAQGCCQKNPVIESIMTRTSIRQFKDCAVGADTIETLLRAGMAAPTAVNRQPWHFVVITGRDVLEALGGRSKGAPLAIAVCGDMTKALEGEAREYWVQDCSAATENILLAAHALGLGAVWQGVYPIQKRVEKVSQLLRLPETLVPLNVIAIGYPDEAPAPKDKWKPENITVRKSL